MNASYRRLRADLAAIGIAVGDVLVVHSSMRAMGTVEGGPMTVLAALSDAVGEEGTLLFPTFTYATSYADSFYSNGETPSCVGLLSETFRRLPGVLRTDHPTHSVGVCGRLATALCEGEWQDDTPMGEHSPYRRLSGVGAKILMLGCSPSHNSYLHALEEEAGVPYALREHQEYTVVTAGGETLCRRVRRHNFVRADGCVYQRYERAVDLLSEGELRRGSLHGAPSLLFDAAALRRRALAKMEEDPLFFVDDPKGYYLPRGSS